MVEDAIRNPDISKSVQRFQLAIESAKVRLDQAISPGLWLLPSKMVVNTESVVGYNNKLKKATKRMRIGVNSDLNIPVRRSTQKHNLGSRAVKLPHSGVETQNSDRESGDRESGDRESGDRASGDRESGDRESGDRESGNRESGVAAAGTELRTKETQVVKSEKSEATAEMEKAKAVSTSHENNLNVLIIVAGALAWFLFR